MTRLTQLQSGYDIAIVGGGIIGAGIARDAAMRGLSVALVEKADYGGGTTSGSTRLIHGGLRYLEMLDFRLVRMDLRERETLLRIAPHLVKPLEFLVPFYDRSLFYRTKLRLGMWLYDGLSYDKSLPNHRFLSASELRATEPQLESRGLQGASAYYDAQVNSPERLCLENILAARALGATTLNYVEAVSAIYEGGRVAGIRVRDVLEGGEAELRARLVVNASGPWFDRVAAKLAPHPRRLIRTTKGIHVACAPVSNKATVLFSKVDGRLFFVIPWLGYSWVGTTDTDFVADPGEARATPEDVEYLLHSASECFPGLLKGDVYWSNAGVRALVMQPGSESSVSRLHRIGTEIPGLISVMGGKITGYRAIAEEATDRICRTLGVRRRCETAAQTLPGARSGDAPDHLHGIYGSRADEVREFARQDEALDAPLGAAYPDIAAQVVHAARMEQCVRLSDFLLRRSIMGFTPDQGMAAAARIAGLLARELDWSAAREAQEIADYREWVRSTQAFREAGVPAR